MTEEEEIDAMLEVYFPDLSEEEQEVERQMHIKASEFILKNGIKANCDTPNFTD